MKYEGQVTAVELHTFNHVQFVFQTGTVFNGDHAFFTDFVHRFSDQFTYGSPELADGTNLSNGFRVRARYGQRFQFFNSGSRQALSIPRFRSIGFMPAATAFRPSVMMACASTVAVVVRRLQRRSL
jgi:hypothetical protein